MKLQLFQVDAFAKRAFEGNPAAVVPLSRWLDPGLMQAIAAENNLSETAFYVATGNDYEIRWFTPVTEVALCGHATLATAFVIFQFFASESDSLTFQSRSGTLTVRRREELLTLDFPCQIAHPCSAPKALIQGLGVQPQECLQCDDYLVVLDKEEKVAALQPDFALLQQLDLRGVTVTAPAESCDFVVRFFAPKQGIAEDPVTGSAYTTLVPYWAKKLNRRKLSARQLSARGGALTCELQGDRVLISGTATLYLQGVIQVDD